jgi:hypothetical protein
MCIIKQLCYRHCNNPPFPPLSLLPQHVSVIRPSSSGIKFVYSTGNNLSLPLLTWRGAGLKAIYCLLFRGTCFRLLHGSRIISSKCKNCSPFPFLISLYPYTRFPSRNIFLPWNCRQQVPPKRWSIFYGSWRSWHLSKFRIYCNNFKFQIPIVVGM